MKEGESGSTAVGFCVPSSIRENGVIFENSTVSNFDAENNVKDMCMQAMRNRNREYTNIITSAKTATGEKGYTVLISAVAMW